MFRCLVSLLLVTCIPALAQGPDADQVRAARKLFDEVPLIDGHNDVPWQLRNRVNNDLRALDLRDDLSTLDPPMHTDIPRLRKGGVGAQFWSVYIPASRRGAEGVKTVIEQIDVARRMIDRYSDTFELALTADDIRRIHREGKIASLMGMEGGQSIGNSLAALRMTYALGARYMTLTHSSNLDWADSGTDTPRVGGLTEFGNEVVREMNRLGMLVDLSHVSPETMHDALDVTEAPIIFSHSSVRAVCDHPRNVPDDVLLRVKENGGVVMITFLSNYISEEFRVWVNELQGAAGTLREKYADEPLKAEAAVRSWREANPAPPNATLEQLADHFDHVRDLIGVDYLGIGSDFDGTTFLADGVQDVTGFPVLLGELLRRGYSEEDIKKIAGLNVLRVMDAAEAVAGRLQSERAPSDLTIEMLDGTTTD